MPTKNAKQTPAKPAPKKSPVKKSSAPETKKPESQVPKSNKEAVFLKWSAEGKPDTDETLLKAYLKLVKGAVKESTIRGWLGEWRRGQNHPKGY